MELQIVAEPAAAAYQIRHKLEILRDYAAAGPPKHGLELRMIGSIEADIVSLNVSD